LDLIDSCEQIEKEMYWRKAMDAQADIGKRLEHFLKTGTLTSNTGLDLMQVTGFTIIADKLNYVRFLSHFRSISVISYHTISD
jgi:DNA-directed RNA polymerase I subunit RPA2